MSALESADILTDLFSFLVFIAVLVLIYIVSSWWSRYLLNNDSLSQQDASIIRRVVLWGCIVIGIIAVINFLLETLSAIP
jgi:small-conductance mechanosensitive channel